MKRLFTAGIAGLMFLTGCAQDMTAGIGIRTPVEERPAAHLSTTGKAVWAVEPSWKLAYIRELDHGITGPWYGAAAEIYGYSQEWPSLWTMEGEVTGYTPDSIVISKNGVCAVADYNGYLLFDQNLITEGNDAAVVAYPGVGFTTHVQYSKDTYVFNPSFTGVTAVEPIPFGIENDVIYYVKDGQVVNRLDGASPMIWDYKTRTVLNVGDPKNPTGCALVSPDGSVISTYAYKMRKQYTFVNGYIEVTNGTQYNVLNPATGTLLCDVWYDDMKWFQEGYCPVAVDGKWGLINTKGEEVLEPVFYDVSTVVNGKAYVAVNSIYGILDVAGTVAAGVRGTLETCYPGGAPDPSGWSDAKFKYKAGICGGDVGPKENALGKLRVNVEGLNIRTDHTTSSKTAGQVVYNTVYTYYDTYTAKDYTWYRIGENQWIADNGSWLTVYGNNIIGTAKVNVSQLIVRKDHSTSAGRDGYAEALKTYDLYEIYEGSDYQWLRIGDGRWIANNGSWVTVTKY